MPASAPQQNQKSGRTGAAAKACLVRTCFFYTILNLLYFLIYMIVVFPHKSRPFDEMLRGGITVKGHLGFFLTALAVSFVIAVIRYRRPSKPPHAVLRYFYASSVWYTILTALLIAAYGFYLDMIYDPYAVTEAALLKGPSFLLTAACLGFALCLPAVNRIYRLKWPAAMRILLHFTSITALSVVFFLFLSDGFSSSKQFLIFAFVFAVLYALACALCFLLNGAKKRDENEAADYENLYLTEDMRRAREREAAQKKKK